MKKVKEGWKTSEFWLSTLLMICTTLYASGIVLEDGSGTADRVVAFLVAALASLGYSASRARVKSGG